MKLYLSLFGIVMLLTASCQHSKPVDLIVHGGTIHALDANNTVFEAMAIADGKIVAVGTKEKIHEGFTAAETLDLEGKHVFPGLIDAHCHLYGLGEQQMIIDLVGTASPEEVIARAKASGAATGEWIRGRGWDQNDWPQKSFPTKEVLDKAFPNNPVFLVRVDGHAVWVNSKAMEIAKITALTPDPDGGKILRSNGTPSGILLDNAIEIVREYIPKPDVERYKTGYATAIQECLSVGITGVHDMGVNGDQIAALKQMITDNALPFRITAYVDGLGEAWDEVRKSEERVFGDRQLVLAGLKLYADGALGSRGALLLEPYSDDPGNRGVQIISEDKLTHETVRALDAGLQVCVHAIGDSAVRLVLNAYERAQAQTKATGIPLRIEHVQAVDPADMPRFAQLGIIPSMQPTHCTSDMYWAEARLGPVRIKSAYPWKTLLKSGCLLPFGSDFPVEHPDPLAGIYAACTRQDKDGRPATAADIEQYFSPAGNSSAQKDRYENGWYGAERLSRGEALMGFTRWAADAAQRKGDPAPFGTLIPKNYADFIVTTVNLETCPPAELLSRQVVATYVGGKQVYKRP